MPNFKDSWEHTKQLVKPQTQEIVEHGWEQHVLIDHKNQIVYRYPRNQNAADKLVDEVSILSALNRHAWNVAIPRIREHTRHFNSYDLIEGEVLDVKLIARLSDTQIGEIGLELGIFLAKLHKINPSIIDSRQTKQSGSLFDYYESRIATKPAAHFYQPAIHDLNQLKNIISTSQVVVHGDLHGLNMVINPRSLKLVGIIDFSEVEVGDPHQDFRKLFMTDERLLEPAVEAYVNAGGHKLLPSSIKLWAYVNEWANVCYFDETPENPTYIRAQTHLRTWGLI